MPAKAPPFTSNIVQWLIYKECIHKGGHPQWLTGVSRVLSAKRVLVNGRQH